MPRIVVLVAVVGIHLALIAVFTVSRDRRRQEQVEERRMVVVFLPPPRVEEAAPSAPPIGEAKINRQRARSPEPPVDDIKKTPPPPAPIDWMHESQMASERQIEALEEEGRRGRGFTPLEANRERSPSASQKPEFRWSQAHTARVEPLPEGGTLVWINDRCAILLSGGFFPICRLGKEEAHGDLFEHMNDAPEPGDWKAH